MLALKQAFPQPTTGARELIEGFAAGEISPVEAVEADLSKIEATNSELSAFIAVDADRAVQAAKDHEQRWTSWRKSRRPSEAGGWQRLPAWGVPISVKDTVEMGGLPTTYGSLAFADNYQPDSPLVVSLRDTGCVILGKTNTSEFALSMVTANKVAPPARNPHDVTRTAGGSSGGAAAATAVGIGAFGLGTDSVGSIRQPAAYCGLYGLKPSTGRVKNRQTWSASPVRSHLGPLARSAEDLAFSWRVLTGDQDPVLPLEATESSRRIRVSPLEGDTDEGSVLAEGVALLRGLESLEFHDDPVQLEEPPSVLSTDGDWVFAADHLAAAEMLVPDFMAKHREDLTAYARKIYDLGPRIRAWEYRRLMRAIDDYRITSQSVFERTDLIVTSIAADPPLLNPQGNLDDLGPKYPLLSVWNLAGNPALAIPLPISPNGLPRSFQVVARRGADRILVSLALALARLQRQTP